MLLKEKLEDAWYSVKRSCRHLERWIAYRTYDKYHVVDTGLKPRYYDKDYILLHACFALLVEFVEVECAHMNGAKNAPDRVAGLAHLDWEIGLGEESSYQAESAKEQKELYVWWKDIRPQRQKLLDAEPPTRTYIDDPVHPVFNPKNWTPEYTKYLDDMNKLEEDLHAEDDAMLIRLTKIRRSLWT